MLNLANLQPVDYLIIGHLTRDLTPAGPRLGGTAAYAALTAQALGLRVGVVTSWGAELPLGMLRSIPIASFPADASTTFENIQTVHGRIQIIHTVAPQLDFYMIPDPWRRAPIVHLGPVAQEVAPSLVRNFPDALVCLTPQGWLRGWNEKGHVFHTDWIESTFMLQKAGAAVISMEDVLGNEEQIEDMASACRVLAVTEAAQGSRVFWNGDVRRFRPPVVKELDPTGAGDIFAAAFFYRLFNTRDPWEAGRFATLLASYSVTREGLAGTPTAEEIKTSLVEVF